MSRTIPLPRTVTRPIAAIAAVSLVLPASLNTLFHLISPQTSDSLAGRLTQAATQPALAQSAAALQVALPMLALGVLVLAWRASAGSPRLAALGGGSLAIGLLLSGLSTIETVVEAVVPAHSDSGTALQIVSGFEHSALGRLGFATIVAESLGIVLLGIALWRSRAVPRLLAGAFVFAQVLQIATHLGDGNALPVFSWGWFTLVLAGCAAVVVRDSGSRPVAQSSAHYATAAAASTIAA